jgi:hypothetical protein
MPMKIGERNLTNGDITIGAGLLVALIATFLPWYSVSASGGGFSYSASISGFGYWSGILFFIALLVGIVYYVLRTFVPGVAIPAMPTADFILYAGLGVFMILMALIFLLASGGGASVPGAGYSAGVSFGLFIAIIAGAAVAVGGYLKKGDPQAATRSLGSAPSGGGYGSPPPPPPA